MSIGRSVILSLLLVISGASLARDHGPILVLGDSLSAAYGIDPGDGWVSLLSRRLETEGVDVVNASISGETTSGGLTRLPGLLDRNRPSIVILELGANDGLRGLSLDQTRTNLDQMIQLAREANAKVLILGIELPVNYGRAFRDRFRAIFHELADQYEAGLVPFLLEGVAMNPELMLGDGIHPNAAAQPTLLDTVWRALSPLMPEEEAAARNTGSDGAAATESTSQTESDTDSQPEP